MASKNKSKANYYRLIIQWSVLIFLAYLLVYSIIDSSYFPDYEAYCPFGGMQAISSFIVSGTLACSMTSVQIVMGFALIIGILILSKLFCGYVCPIGTITEWLGKLGDTFKIRFTITGIADKLLRILKYVLLFITFYFTLQSSELFCRQFDPFFASFTGFSSDVNMTYAIIALIIVVFGSIFIRQAWCKYLCPLSAASNIFSNFYLFGILILLFAVLSFSGIHIDWIYLLIVIVLAGAVWEIITMRTYFFPIMKIKRHEDICTNCNKCTKACPQAIDVAKVQFTVNHVDCNMCGDCIAKCPTKNSLTINGKYFKWLPSLVLLVLFVFGMIASSYIELPTVNIVWGNEEAVKSASVFEMSGIKNVKCYGSSMSFVEQMKTVDGVLGVETYVGSHSVKVFYDPSILNPEKIKAAIFSPVKNTLLSPDSTISKISVLKGKILNFFDKYDSFYLSKLLESNNGIFGYTTEFGEPVEISFFIDENKTNAEAIKKLIESEEVVYKIRDIEFKEKINFKLELSELHTTSISLQEFIGNMFEPYTKQFNNFDNYSSNQIQSYKIFSIQLLEPDFSDNLPYIVSHLSADTGIVSLSTSYENDSTFIKIGFISSITNEPKIINLLASDSLHVTYRNGETENLKNPLKLDQK